MSKDIANPVDLSAGILEVLQQHAVSPLDHFASVTAGRSLCMLCQGERQVSEIVFNMHSQKAVSFEMAKAFKEEETCPCPDCYGRGYVYSSAERQDRAAAVLLNKMPEQAPSQGPIVQRFHRAETVEQAFELDKEMQAALPIDEDVVDGEYVVSLDEDEAMLDQIEAEQAQESDVDNEVFWDRPDDGEDII